MAIEAAPIIAGIVIPTLTSWLSDQLPRPGLSGEENERRIRNIVLACLVGFGVYYMMEKAGVITHTPITTSVQPKLLFKW